jgi:hypothetical protein
VSKSPSRLQHLMVVRPTSPERQHLSSARRSAVPRLAADAHGTVGVHAIDDARAIVGVSECAGDGSGIPPEWC